MTAERRRSALWRRVHRLGVWAALLVGTAVTLGPYVLMVSLSFRSNAEIFSRHLTLLPEIPRPENYVLAWTREHLSRSMFNSLVMATGEMAGVIVTSVLAGYAFARLRFRGRDLVFLLVLGTVMVPTQVTLIPNLVLIRWLGWISTYPGLIVPRMVTAFGIFMIRQFFLSIPGELGDAARIDGCGHLRILLQIMLPLSGPALATLAIFSFTQSWNEFFWPLIVVQSERMQTVQLTVAALKGTEYVQWGEVMAAVTITAIPTMLIYLVFQRYFVRGVAMTGLKG